eukprot:1148315-Amphidinium_carterae.3
MFLNFAPDKSKGTVELPLLHKLKLKVAAELYTSLGLMKSSSRCTVRTDSSATRTSTRTSNVRCTQLRDPTSAPRGSPDGDQTQGRVEKAGPASQTRKEVTSNLCKVSLCAAYAQQIRLVKNA